jgi:Beige/BEACH domain/PH domain associated with Beige/BEACH
MSFRSPNRANAERVERDVLAAARRLGDGVQKIVLAAKAKQGDTDWKSELLVLLGDSSHASSVTSEGSAKGEENQDIHVLLNNSSSESFVQRCVESELPPNLIHCMRLLRVLELQHAAQASEGQGLLPIAENATTLVSRLLCSLCVDPSVGEIFRPHLFGLFALSGASYPSSGVHVAKAANEVIIALSERCLSRQLVWFIHDRKMVIHMTDDIKELCGISASASSAPPIPRGLTTTEAEQYGLWAIAFETVVKLVAESCRFRTVELLKDFESVGGYDALLYAIQKSTEPHGRKLVELLSVLACCPNDQTETNEKVAMNIRVFDMFEHLLVNSNPLLVHLKSQRQEMDVSVAPKLPELSRVAVQLRFCPQDELASPFSFDVASALLSATLQLFSDHPDNFEILEDRQHALTYSILAFPCFSDNDLKNFVLKTLEFVLTGVGIKDEVSPVNACVEVFFSLAEALVKPRSGVHSDDVAGLSDDLELMGRTLEKLLQFDQRVAPIMVESGILTANLDSFISNLEGRLGESKGSSPPETTKVDLTVSMVCRVVKHLVAHKPVSPSQSDTDGSYNNLHKLLRIAVHHLGTEAARATASVFEMYLTSFASPLILEGDVRFALDTLEDLAALIYDCDTSAIATLVERQIVIVSLIRTVLETRSSARNVFCACGGYDSILRTLAWQSESGRVSHPLLLQFLCTLISLVDATIGVKSRSPAEAVDSTPLVYPVNMTVDPCSLQLSSGTSSTLNRNFLRSHAYYIDLAATISLSGLLAPETNQALLNICLQHIDPGLTMDSISRTESIRNADAVRLVLAVAIFMCDSDTGKVPAEMAFDCILNCCMDEDDQFFGRELLRCGIASSLTNPREFGSVLFDSGHHLQSRLVKLLCRIASLNMSFLDFISILRGVAGPILEGSDGRVRLPVISSSIKTRLNSVDSTAGVSDSLRRTTEDECVARLQVISEIARAGDRYPRMLLGGESINTIAVLMHQVKLEDRLRTAAEQKSLRFLEVERIDSSSLTVETGTVGAPLSNSTQDQWMPLQSSGFTYSLWLLHGGKADNRTPGNLYVLDISNSSTQASAPSTSFSSYLSVWYDVQNQRFNILSSASNRGEPTAFPVSPLRPDCWHHVLITYSPAKRSMISRKASFCLYVNGRGLEADVRIDSLSLPPSARVYVGCPNPCLAASGIVRGALPVWEAGPILMLSTVLLDLDATAIYTYGPCFPGALWGDRPQRTSLAATGTLAFSMLAESGEPGSIASSLKKRDVQRLEAAGYSVLGHTDDDKDDLSQLGLYCTIPPDCVVFAFNASTTAIKLRNEAVKSQRSIHSERLVNLARLNFANDCVASDAVIYGRSSSAGPTTFADSLQWAGGPALLMPLVSAARVPRALTLSLEILREATQCHPPNLEMMQAGGGYRILAVLLKEKGFADVNALDECLGFAVKGFQGNKSAELDIDPVCAGSIFANAVESNWVLADVDAMKHLLLNHQVWELSKGGPDIPLRLLYALNVLVSQKSIHKAFNARRLHLVGIVQWALHLMLEGAELYSTGEKVGRDGRHEAENPSSKSTWYYQPPLVSDVQVGGDPGNAFLLECKNLLRRVLTFMLTPGDLEALADSIVYTLSIAGSTATHSTSPKADVLEFDGLHGVQRMLPGPAARLYLVRLLEELIVDGVNEIAASLPLSPPKRKDSAERDIPFQTPVQYHAGGVASPDQPYLSTSVTRGKLKTGLLHPKHQQAQAFLSAFAGFLTPVWFATVLEGCRDEASASAVLRLLVLMLQGSASFEAAFWGSGGFSAFVLSVPKFSTCSGMVLPLLSELLHVPILHLHSFPNLDSEQLCEVFDTESLSDFIPNSNEGLDPSSGVFALLAECLGRNMKLVSSQSSISQKARETNDAIIELISHRHAVSPGFQEFCSTAAFLEPLSQALCLIYNERISYALRGRRRAMLADVPRDLTPTQRFVSASQDIDSGGIGMVRLLRMVTQAALSERPRAATIFYSLFRSFPIHATPQQVEAFHLVLIEQCRSVVKEVIDHGTPLSLANCVGLCSVLLDQLLSGFFSAEAVLESVRLALSVLNAIARGDSDVVKGLGASEFSLLSLDAAHVTSLICIASLRMSLPVARYDPGDDNLQAAILTEMEPSMDSILLVPSRDGKNKRATSTQLPRPSTNAKTYPIWQAVSLARCLLPQKYSLYPDLADSENPEIATIAPLLVELHRLLLSPRDDIRSFAVSLLVALLQNRQSVLSKLLVAEVTTGSTTETIDIVNRGGFRALLTAHEAAVADRSGAPFTTVKRKYASFFDWFERNQNQVQLVFHAVNEKGAKLFPGLDGVTVPQEEAIANEQKCMLMRLTIETADNAILGGIERGELARRCAERTTDSHSRWKRQGFDDLAFGATKWKVVLRQLKGSCSVWEGGFLQDKSISMDLSCRLQDLRKRSFCVGDVCVPDYDAEIAARWKLDLSEGYERQRRRLLPNYEFQGLYNVDEAELGVEYKGDSEATVPSNGPEGTILSSDFFVGPEVEATAELLKDLNIKRSVRPEEEEDDDDDAEVEVVEGNSTTTTALLVESSFDEATTRNSEATERVSAPITSSRSGAEGNLSAEATEDNDDASSYGLITGLLQAGDWPEKSYNVTRCTGLEVTKALLLWCQEAIYVIDGFEQIGGAGMDGKITRVEREQSSFYISLRPKDFKAREEMTSHVVVGTSEPTSGQSKAKKKQSRAQADSNAQNDVLYQHRSQRIAFSALHSAFKRRYQLQQIALEFYDVNKCGTLIAFSNQSEREEVLSKVLQAKLPNSIFSSSYGTFISYSKFMTNLKARIVSQWVNGKMSNFEFLMHLNSFAGRSFNDLTQYPVFPWVIADYDSDEIDLSDPKIYRDLSKPMGAIGRERAKQFQERYDSLASTCFTEDDPPPFHYGTHYSCAAYVLYYLMRLEPFSRLALALQGGRFDVADRLFHDVGRSWKSASSENLQDVRELIPEFFYLPEFFSNTNNFDFGETQRGKTVHDVSLPKWAKSDPHRFVRINRQALESEYVSKHLHLWLDLIFGIKQRGQEAIDALNVFVHVTYEDEVDLDNMVDPVQRASTIAQIQNFGQTPSRLERKPFPQRLIFRAMKDKSLDLTVTSSLASLTPPFCVVGAPHKVAVRALLSDTCKHGLAGQSDSSVGDLCLVRGQLIGLGRNCALVALSKRYFRFGGVNNGVSVHALSATVRNREINKALSFHDSLHRAPITAAKASLNGDWLVTGCADSTVRVWQYDGHILRLRATFCGHEGSHIRCIDVSTEFGVIVTGCGMGRILLWDLRTLTFVRPIRPEAVREPAVSVSINHSNGNVLTLVGGQLNLFDINGNPLGRHKPYTTDQPTCAVATDCPEWMDKGVVAISGHQSGDICFWGMDFDQRALVVRHVLQENPHSSVITALRVAAGNDTGDRAGSSLRSPGFERQDTLLVGDASGRVSLCKVSDLSGMSPPELAQIAAELEDPAPSDTLR